MELADIPEVLHPAFPQPDDPNATIWRYMDMDKFRSLVSSGRLYMARADLLGDDFEGTTPSAEKEYWRLLVNLAETPEERQQWSSMRSSFRSLQLRFDQPITSVAGTWRKTKTSRCGSGIPKLPDSVSDPEHLLQPSGAHWSLASSSVWVSFSLY